MFTGRIYLTPGNNVDLDIQLQPWPVRTTLDSVRLIGEFNGYDTASGIPMSQDGTGRWLGTLPCRNDTVRYQILGIAERFMDWPIPLSGISGNRYEFDGMNSYITVCSCIGDSADIVVDPKQLPRPSGNAFVTARSSDSTVRIVTEFLRDEFTGTPATSAIDSLETELRSLTGLYRHLAFLRYLNIHGSRDTALVQIISDELSPLSPLWSVHPRKMLSALSASGVKYGTNRYWAFVDSAVRYNPSTKVRLYLLDQLTAATFSYGDSVRFRSYYRELVFRYPETYTARSARHSYAPDRTIQKERPIPPVDLTLLGDSTRQFSVNSVGKYLLIDFWATWCGPCIREMPLLHELHTEHGDSLEILSISFDGSEDIVRRFREKEWPMPWNHSVLTGARADDIEELFGVAGLPWVILVDPTGKIIMGGHRIRADDVEEFFENNSQEVEGGRDYDL